MGMAPSSEREGVGLPAAVEEVVGRRRHHRPVPEPQGQAGQQERGVDVAGVVGGEDDRGLEVDQALLAPQLGRGHGPGQRPGHVVEHHGPGQAHRVAPRPGRVVVDAELGLGGRPGDRPGPGGGGQGESGPSGPGDQGRAGARWRLRRGSHRGRRRGARPSGTARLGARTLLTPGPRGHPRAAHPRAGSLDVGHQDAAGRADG